MMQVVQPDPRTAGEIDEAVVDAVRDAADAEGFHLVKHTVTVDHEVQERKIVLTVVRSTSGQQELELNKKKEPGEE